MCGDYILDSENFVGVEFEVMAGGEGDRKGEKDNVEKRCA
jgi:hypothetical protein